MQALRNTIHRFLRSCGWEMQRISTIQKRHLAACHQDILDRWRALQVYNARTVLDIGANEGQFATLIRSLLPDAKIISFEPLKSCVETLKRQSSALEPFQVFHTALGSQSGTAKINRSVFTPSSSLLTMAKLHKEELPHTAESEVEEIRVSVLDEILEGLTLEEPYLVKIDVQGFEEQVLLGAAKSLRKAAAVVVEVSAKPMYVGEPGFHRIYEMMKSYGFDFCGTVDQWRSSQDGRILQFDCLFENPARICSRS